VADRGGDEVADAALGPHPRQGAALGLPRRGVVVEEERGVLDEAVDLGRIGEHVGAAHLADDATNRTGEVTTEVLDEGEDERRVAGSHGCHAPLQQRSLFGFHRRSFRRGKCLGSIVSRGYDKQHRCDSFSPEFLVRPRDRPQHSADILVRSD
jgi:hypothetical protein